jgi:hypothetical protein
MKKLTTDQFARARDFIHSQARPLEKVLFELEFEEGSVENVLLELRKFQNPDGGFGQALEPDLRTPTSSALCSEIGLRYLAERNIPADHPMVGVAVAYLLDSFDAAAQIWRVIPEDANDHPHAPWWHDEDGSLVQTFDDFRVIPRAGILAALYQYAELVSAEWLAAVTERTVSDIENLAMEQFGGGGDTLVYALRLAEAPGLATSLKSRLVPRLREVTKTVVTRDPEKWGSYSIPPLKIASTPQSLAADLLRDDLQNHLDYLIEQQTAAGCWEPTWSWFGSYPEQWEQAKIEWRGLLTLDNLLALRAFGRVEG